MENKIAALLAKAESAAALGNTEEAEAYNAKAEELMIKYAIDRSTIKGIKAEIKKFKTLVFRPTKQFAVGSLMGAGMVVRALGGYGMVFSIRKYSWNTGKYRTKKDNLKFASPMGESMVSLLESLYNQALMGAVLYPGKSARVSYVDGFWAGAADRARDTREKVDVSKELVVVERDAEAWFLNEYGAGRKSTRYVNAGHAYQRGKIDGANAFGGRKALV